jgi:exonuclease I
MTRALRPEGIEWPFDSSGKPSNRLELLTSVNNLSHESAHDALSDVNATIAVARLIFNKQPKLFKFLLEMRNKKIPEVLDHMLNKVCEEKNEVEKNVCKQSRSKQNQKPRNCCS